MEKDILDFIMEWRIMKPLCPIYRKHKEGLLYLFFGGMTFFLGIGIYIILVKMFYIHELVANVISWIAGVSFSFFITKKWVFRNNNWNFRYVIRQMGGFCVARLATLLLQELLLYVFISCMNWNTVLIKIGSEMLNIVLNYFASKLIIFNRKKI